MGWFTSVVGQYFACVHPPVALISVLIEQFANVNGFITALAPVRERSGFSCFTSRWCGIEEISFFNSVSEKKALARC